jgi:hypothetical protein
MHKFNPFHSKLHRRASRETEETNTTTTARLSLAKSNPSCEHHSFVSTDKAMPKQAIIISEPIRNSSVKVVITDQNQSNEKIDHNQLATIDNGSLEEQLVILTTPDFVPNQCDSTHDQVDETRRRINKN